MTASLREATQRCNPLTNGRSVVWLAYHWDFTDVPIQSFADIETEKFFATGRTRAGWQAAKSVAARKLDQLDAATVLDDLRAPPGNRLEVLKGDKAGQVSIRINDQWRILFKWSATGPTDVAILDYHSG